MTPILGITSSAVVPPAAGSFESIATASGTGSSATITFSSIPSGYQHLQIRYIAKYSGTGTNAQTSYTIRFNGDTSANYARHAIRGTGAAVAATGTASQTEISTNYTIIPNSSTGFANIHGVGIIDIHDYLSTSKNKTVRAFGGVDTNLSTGSTGTIALYSGLWFKTPEAITSIDIISGSNNWTTTTQFALYGIKGA